MVGETRRELGHLPTVLVGELFPEFETLPCPLPSQSQGGEFSGYHSYLSRSTICQAPFVVLTRENLL